MVRKNNNQISICFSRFRNYQNISYRYYLEPAIPLKSLTSSTHVVTSMASALNASSQSSMPPHALPPIINGMANGNSNKDGSALRAITLTPPTSIRLTSSRNKNGIKSNGIVQSTTATSSVNNGINNNFHEQFTSDPAKVKNLNDARQWLYDNRDKIENNNNNFNNNNMSNGLTNGTTTNHHHQHNNHHPNGLLSNHDTKNSLLSNGLSIDSNNKFTPDTDFVADFGSASIFDATALSSSTIATSATATINHTNCINNNNNNTNGCNNNSNNSNKLVNGTVTGANGLQNGSATTVKNANANFADFDHNPIYNASGNLNFFMLYIMFVCSMNNLCVYDVCTSTWYSCCGLCEYY